MILIVNISKERLHAFEFVKPIEDILKNNKVAYITKNYQEVSDSDLKSSEKVIICGTSLGNNDFLKNMKKFSWIKYYEKPILAICGGAHIIGLSLGYKLKKKKQIGLKEIDIKRGFFGVKGKIQAYHLHQFHVLPEL